MTDYPIYLWERKPEWPAVVEAVTCPVCKAPPMSKCFDMGGMSGKFGGNPIYRVDWHAQRKYLALDEWRKQEMIDNPGTPEEAPDATENSSPTSDEGVEQQPTPVEVGEDPPAGGTEKTADEGTETHDDGA